MPPFLLDFCSRLGYTYEGMTMRLDSKRGEQLTSIEDLLKEERRRIGEALHSRAAQSLSHALFLLNLYEEEERKEDLVGARQAIKMAVNEIRHAIHELRSEEPWPLIPSIRDCITDFKERSQMPVRFLAEGSDEHVPPEIHHFVLTLVQEGLNNILKHAGATSCEVSLTIQERAVAVTVKDNGVGLKPDAKKEGAPHFGLKFLRERAEQMGGKLQIDSANGKGTTLKSSVPFPANL